MSDSKIKKIHGLSDFPKFTPDDYLERVEHIIDRSRQQWGENSLTLATAILLEISTRQKAIEAGAEEEYYCGRYSVTKKVESIYLREILAMLIEGCGGISKLTSLYEGTKESSNEDSKAE